jgi:hypothetical protein
MTAMRRFFGTGRAAMFYPFVIAICFVIQILTIAYVIKHSVPAHGMVLNFLPGTRPPDEWIADAPIKVMMGTPLLANRLWPAVITLGLLQSLALYGLYRGIERHGFFPNLRLVTVGSGILMAIAAFLSPVMASADLYAYIGYGFDPTYYDSVVGTRVILPAGFSIINDMYGQPLMQNVYGPAFYGLMSFVRLWNVPLVVDLYVMRALSTASFIGILWLLAPRLRVAERVVLALCPALYLEWILDAHNDVFAVLFVALAVRLAPKGLRQAAVAAGVAGTFKIALFPVALCVAALQTTLSKRLQFAAIAAFVAVGLMLITGPELIHTLSQHVFTSDDSAAVAKWNSQASVAVQHSRQIHALIVRGLSFLAIGIVVGAAVLWGRTSAGAAFIFATFAPSPYQWYLVWGIPYAAMAETFAYVPIALPTLTWLEHSGFAPFLPMQAILAGFAIASALIFVMRRGTPKRLALAAMRAHRKPLSDRILEEGIG